MRRLIALAGVAALAACDTAGPDDATVLEEAGKLAQPLPGLYRSTTTMERYELPDADAREAEIVRDRLAGLGPQEREFCLTPQEASGGFRDMLAAMQEGDCDIERFEAGGETLDARMRCVAEGGLVSTVAMRGRADPQRSRIELEMEQSHPSIPGGRAKIAMRVENERIGDCPAEPPAGDGGSASR